jgi:hypothetical protein
MSLKHCISVIFLLPQLLFFSFLFILHFLSSFFFLKQEKKELYKNKKFITPFKAKKKILNSSLYMNCALSNWSPTYKKSIQQYQLQRFKVKKERK